MEIARIVFYSIAVIVNVVGSDFHREMCTDQSIQKVLQSIAHQDVIIVIRKQDVYDADRVLDAVAQAAISARPSQIFVAERSDFESRRMASYRTLLIYIYASENDVDYRKLNATIDNIRQISYSKHVPRLLLIIGSEKRALDAQGYLQYLWDSRVLDVIILEVSPRPECAQSLFVAVHCFNGFDYSRLTEISGGIDCHLMKPRDMYGGSFKMTFEQIEPYGTLEPANETSENEDGILELGRLGGLAELFADSLSNILNVTIVQPRFWQDSDVIYNAQGLVYTDWYDTNYEHTVAVGDDRICLLMPAMSVKKLLINASEIVRTIFIGVLLAAVIWCASVMLKIGERARDPLNTISLLLGIAPPHEPRTLVEKTLFVGVMMTAATYTTLFHAELFEVGIELTSDSHVSTFQELYDTGREVVVSPMMYRELEASEKLSPEFLKRFTSISENHQSELNASRAYFMSEIDGKLAEIAHVDRNGARLFRLSDLCIMSHYRVHTLPVKSPFKNEINRLLLSLTEHGFVTKYINDFWRNKESRNNEKWGKKINSNAYSVYIASLIVLVGHAAAFVIFVGEILVARYHRRKISFSAKFSRIMQVKKNVKTVRN